MAVFKESGAIEYSSNVLLGLQLTGAGTGDFDVNAEKKKDPRQIEMNPPRSKTWGYLVQNPSLNRKMIAVAVVLA
jgi:hypothetical protein